MWLTKIRVFCVKAGFFTAEYAEFCAENAEERNLCACLWYTGCTLRPLRLSFVRYVARGPCSLLFVLCSLPTGSQVCSFFLIDQTPLYTVYPAAALLY